jgi:predicted transcriptional regulator
MKKLKVEGHNNLLRDSETGAIINNDKSGFSSYMTNKTIKHEESTRIQNVERDLANIHSEISELKLLIKEALNGSR